MPGTLRYQTLDQIKIFWLDFEFQSKTLQAFGFCKGGCIIQQAFDGFVSVERKYGNELFTLKTSPSNGKARLQSSFIYVTASEGNESHLFVKSKDRRIHHSSKVIN